MSTKKILYDSKWDEASKMGEHEKGSNVNSRGFDDG